MNHMTIERDGLTLVRVSRPRAVKAFDAGNRVYASPCNVNLYCPWYADLPYLIKTDEWSTFDTVCNNIWYYNCDAAQGRYLIYWIVESEASDKLC